MYVYNNDDSDDDDDNDNKEFMQRPKLKAKIGSDLVHQERLRIRRLAKTMSHEQSRLYECSKHLVRQQRMTGHQTLRCSGRRPEFDGTHFVYI